MSGIGAHHSPVSETVVWLTPPEILQALGDFDLDPCACSLPRPWPTAAQHLTIEDDGLAQPWHGRIWMNPPYGSPKIIGPWMRRLAEHGCGTALIFARTETAVFFECVWGRATAILFIDGRLHFHYPDGARARPPIAGHRRAWSPMAKPMRWRCAILESPGILSGCVMSRI